jgi:hypothetical protein
MAKGQMTQKEKQGGFANSFQMFAAKAPSESDSSCHSSERSGRAAAQNIKRLVRFLGQPTPPVLPATS